MHAAPAGDGHHARRRRRGIFPSATARPRRGISSWTARGCSTRLGKTAWPMPAAGDGGASAPRSARLRWRQHARSRITASSSPRTRRADIFPCRATACCSMRHRCARRTQAAGRDAAPARSETSVYLATGISILGSGRRLNYTVIAGVPSLDGHKLNAYDLWLNDWAESDLPAKAGDTVALSYLVPAWDGSYREETATFIVRGVHTLAPSDRGMTPDFDGITNAESIDQWNPPFPIDLHRVTPRDEVYWKRYRATPKAFISLDAARKMWASGPAGAHCGLGHLGAHRPAGRKNAPRSAAWLCLTACLQQLTPESGGLDFRPVRRLALDAANRATDFGELFLSMSFFLVLAAAGMAGMLMRLDGRPPCLGSGASCSPAVSARVRSPRPSYGEGLLLTAAGTLARRAAGHAVCRGDHPRADHLVDRRGGHLDALAAPRAPAALSAVPSPG